MALLHRKHEPDDPDTPECRQLQGEVDAAIKAYDWDAYRRKAGFGTYTLAGLIYILPKIGPLKMVAIKGPTADTEAEYLRSVTLSLAVLHHLTARFTPPATVPASDEKNRSVAALFAAVAATNPDALLPSKTPVTRCPIAISTRDIS